MNLKKICLINTLNKKILKMFYKNLIKEFKNIPSPESIENNNFQKDNCILNMFSKYTNNVSIKTFDKRLIIKESC